MGPAAAAAAASSLSKPEQQTSQQNGGVQVLQVQNFVMYVALPVAAENSLCGCTPCLNIIGD